MNIPGITQKQIILQFMNDILFDPQWIHYYIISPMKFNKIKSTKGRGILILIAAFDLQISSLHPICQICQSITVQLNPLPTRHGNQ